MALHAGLHHPHLLQEDPKDLNRNSSRNLNLNHNLNHNQKVNLNLNHNRKGLSMPQTSPTNSNSF